MEEFPHGTLGSHLNWNQASAQKRESSKPEFYDLILKYAAAERWWKYE